MRLRSGLKWRVPPRVVLPTWSPFKAGERLKVWLEEEPEEAQSCIVYRTRPEEGKSQRLSVSIKNSLMGGVTPSKTEGEDEKGSEKSNTCFLNMLRRLGGKFLSSMMENSYSTEYSCISDLELAAANQMQDLMPLPSASMLSLVSNSTESISGLA